MNDQIRSHFAEIELTLSKSGIPEARQKTISESIAKLPLLYKQYRETNSSRFGDDIARIVQSLLCDVSLCPDAEKKEVDFREGLHRLHEDLGIPKLPLKAPVSVKWRKVGKK